MIEQISPTSAERLRQCPLRFAGTLARGGTARTPNTFALLGTAAHLALETTVKEKTLFGSDWQSAIYEAWDEACAELAARNEAQESGDSLDAWPGYRIRRARLRNMGQALRELLWPVKDAASLLPEVQLEAKDFPIRGLIDLVVRDESAHWIVDYKTGTVIDPESSEPRASYVRQMRLYAFLEWQSEGSWPDRALLLPARGPIVDVAVEPEACLDYVREVMVHVDRFNARAPNEQPGRASDETCRFCPYPPSCGFFWAACDRGELSAITGFRGEVKSVAVTPLGGASISVEEKSTAAELTLKHVDPEHFPVVNDLNPGTRVALVRYRTRAEDGVNTVATLGANSLLAMVD